MEELKNKVDHKSSLSIARERMGFNCSGNEAEDIYSKLKLKLELSRPKTENGFEKYMKKVERACNKKMEKLREKHDEELEKFEKSFEDERMKLEKRCKVESAFIRATHANSSVGIDKLRALDKDYAKKMEELERKISIRRKELEARHQIERNAEQEKIAGHMERVKSLSHHKVPEESDGQNGVKSQVAEPIVLDKNSNGTVSINGNFPTQQDSEREASKATMDVTESIVSALREDMENSSTQRLTCEIDDSINASENIAALKGDGTGTCRPEQLCASSTGQTDKDTNSTDDVIADSSSALVRDQINEASSSKQQLTSDTTQVY